MTALIGRYHEGVRTNAVDGILCGHSSSVWMFWKEEAVVEDVDEFDEFGGYSVVAPIDTGINVYHNHFAMNGTYPDWLLEA